MTKKEGIKIRKTLKTKGISISKLAKAWGKSRWHIYAVLLNKHQSKWIEESLRMIGGQK